MNILYVKTQELSKLRESQFTTKPINNTGFGLNRRVSVFLLSPQNLWDFALDKEKKKQNKKISLCAWRKANASLLPYCS